MLIARCLFVLVAIASLAAEDSAAAQARIISEIEAGRMSAGGGVRQLAQLGDEAYLVSLPALLTILESRQADEVVADSLLSTLARVDKEIPAPLTVRVKAWTSGVTDGQFLTLLEVHQREFSDLRAEAERTEKLKSEVAVPPLANGAPPSTQAVEASP